MTYDPDNNFQRILRGQKAFTKVAENAHALALEEDIDPYAPVHVLVIPTGNYSNYHDFMSRARPEEIAGLFKLVGDVVLKKGIQDSGYRLIVNAGPDTAQKVPKHFHVHVIGGRPLGEWRNPIPPAVAKLG